MLAVCEKEETMRKKKLLEHPVRMFREEELSKLPKDNGKPVVIAELFSP